MKLHESFGVFGMAKSGRTTGGEHASAEDAAYWRPSVQAPTERAGGRRRRPLLLAPISQTTSAAGRKTPLCGLIIVVQ